MFFTVYVAGKNAAAIQRENLEITRIAEIANFATVASQLLDINDKTAVNVSNAV
jgi:hypothetical protein